jgi:predicted nucleic acid-binding protein
VERTAHGDSFFYERVRFGGLLLSGTIIAAALEASCSRLYSEDLKHGQRIERLTIENPFLEG